MSEYQYYEFQAIDRALTDQEQDEIGRISSRVDLSPHRAAFTYNYGDFRGDPVKVLAKYFDAMLYITNWGSRWLYFRMPRALVTPKALAPYCVEDIIFTSTTGGHVLLGIRQDEEGGDWIDGEGELTPLIPLRQQILEGDYRALYLAWLMANEFADEMEEGDRLEPPVPAGLRNLSKPLKAFVEFFGIDNDLITVAAEASPEAEPEASLESWIPRLAESEREEFLRRLVRGDSSVPMQLRLRLTEIGRQQAPAATRQAPPRRSAAELVRRAQERKDERAGQARQKREAARLRKLEALATQEPQLWDQVTSLVAQKQTKAYDQAVGILKDLRDLAEHRDQEDTFQARVRELQQRHRSLSGLRYRLKEAGLLSEEA